MSEDEKRGRAPISSQANLAGLENQIASMASELRSVDDIEVLKLLLLDVDRLGNQVQRVPRDHPKAANLAAAWASLETQLKAALQRWGA